MPGSPKARRIATSGSPAVRTNMVLISCASVANLQLAAPLRLVSVALSLAGGALGVLLALPLMPVDFARLGELMGGRSFESPTVSPQVMRQILGFMA